MSAARVLSAAAALREFDLDQVAAFCDESPAVIVAVLAAASDCVEQIEDPAHRWRVVDQEELRSRYRALTEPEPPGLALPRFSSGVDMAETRLRYAEESLLSWDDQRPYEERRLQLMAATNALRQAAASMSPTPSTWWQVEMRADSVVPDNPAVDSTTLTRLQVAEVVAYLTLQVLNGREPDANGVVLSAKRLLKRAHDVDLDLMSDLVERFIDLVLTLTVATSNWVAPGRLVAATATHRVRAAVRSSVVTGLDLLIPVVEGIGLASATSPKLFEELEALPAGRTRVVVFTELLGLLPGHFDYRAVSSCLLGTLTEAFTAPDTTSQLRQHAMSLESDLNGLPFPSDNALIGSANFVLQRLAEEGAQEDTELAGRSDRLRADFLRLAQVSVR